MNTVIKGKRYTYMPTGESITVLREETSISGKVTYVIYYNQATNEISRMDKRNFVDSVTEE